MASTTSQSRTSFLPTDGVDNRCNREKRWFISQHFCKSHLAQHLCGLENLLPAAVWTSLTGGEAAGRFLAWRSYGIGAIDKPRFPDFSAADDRDWPVRLCCASLRPERRRGIDALAHIPKTPQGGAPLFCAAGSAIPDAMRDKRERGAGLREPGA